MQYWDSNGSPVVLGAFIGGGGEGDVYDAVNFPDAVVKIYKPGRISDDTRLKITAMVHNRPPTLRVNGHFRIAWPAGHVYTGQGRARLAGYLMPKLDTAEFHPIYRYSIPNRRKIRLQESQSKFTYRNLALMARNLAAAVAALHRQDYVIGDLNSNNVLANEAGQIALIDTDSFQVRDPRSQKIYHCRVGRPEYTPPELQGIAFSGVARTENHDLFSLSVMIYQLLFQGKHPFDGTYDPSRGGRELPQPGDKIGKGCFVHSEQSIYIPDRGSILIWNSLPVILKWAFGGSLAQEKRNSAQAWSSIIGQSINHMRRCQRNELHYCFKAKGCVWCRYQMDTSIDPFPAQRRPGTDPSGVRPGYARVRHGRRGNCARAQFHWRD